MRSVAPGIGVGRNAQANDRGEFRLSGLPSGSYHVMAEPRPRSPYGTQASTAVALVSTYYPGKSEISGASLIEVTAGNTTDGIDFRMQQAAMMTVSGIVFDDAGRPVGGAYVSLNEVPSITLRSSTAITQRDGTFRIDVPNGTYRVLASIPVVVPRGGSVITTGRASGTNNPGVEIKVEGRPVSDVKVIARRP
jgi:hypothetical protein